MFPLWPNGLASDEQIYADYSPSQMCFEDSVVCGLRLRRCPLEPIIRRLGCHALTQERFVVVAGDLDIKVVLSQSRLFTLQPGHCVSGNSLCTSGVEFQCSVVEMIGMS